MALVPVLQLFSPVDSKIHRVKKSVTVGPLTVPRVYLWILSLALLFSLVVVGCARFISVTSEAETVLGAFRSQVIVSNSPTCADTNEQNHTISPYSPPVR